MTDLRKAAEMALEALEWHVSRTRPIEKTTEAIEALRQALAQPEQEPVAWQVMVENEPMKEFSIKEMAHDWAVTEKLRGSQYSYWIRPLYTAPPKRKWVGLTNEERVQAFVDAGLDLAYMDHDVNMKISKVIESRLKEKNT